MRGPTGRSAAVRVGSASVVLLGVCLGARGQRQVAADVYLDKLHGMWMGQLLGNYAGRGDVPGLDRRREGYVVRGGGEFDVGWGDVLSTATWQADDDTSLEYMYLSLLGDLPDPNAAAIGQTWQDNIPAGDLYIANRQARWLMEPPPVGADMLPPETGTFRNNLHAYAIDAQIATESLGALLPGMRQKAADLCERFATVTNEGFPVHAAQFYAAMYAAAALESDVETIVAQGLEVVPDTSRTHEVIQAVRGLYEADKAAGRLTDPNAWRQTQTMLFDNYGSPVGSSDRYRGWIESTVNVGLTTMAVLYGQGEFRRTVEIGVLGGYDADCNPATAGGLIGMVRGYQGAGGFGGILADLPATPNDPYDVTSLQDVGCITTVSQVAADFRAAGEAQIVLAGGSVEGSGPGAVYLLPDEALRPPDELPDPAGPGGLVGRMIAAGGAVNVSASVAVNNPARDRSHLDAVIDGITDVRYNGRVAYSTSDGDPNQPAGGDFYQLSFPRPVTFRSLVFYEGDVYGGSPNVNPRLVETRGGYFLNLTVEALLDGVFREVGGLRMSEPLDPAVFFQRIELTFDPVVTEAIRIRGDAGGYMECTTILELEAFGGLGLPGDTDENGVVDGNDLLAIEAGFDGAEASWQTGDFDFDGAVTHLDFLAWKRNAGTDFRPPADLPEPTSLVLLGALLPLIARRPRAAQPRRGERT